MTNREAAELVTAALNTGRPLTAQCPNGDILTAGRKCGGVGGYHALRWGRSKWADPSGREVAWDPMPMFLAADIVRQCGRGNAAKAARAVLAQ